MDTDDPEKPCLIDPGTGDPRVFEPTDDENEITNDVIEGLLSNGTSVTLDTASGFYGPGGGDIVVAAPIDFTDFPGDDMIPVEAPDTSSSAEGDGVTLTLIAADDIEIRPRTGINGSSLGNKLNVVLQANHVSAGGGDYPDTGSGDVNVHAHVITNGGSFTSSGFNFNSRDGPIDTAGGAVSVNHTGDVDINAPINTNGGRFSSSGMDLDNNGGAINTGGSYIDISHSGEVRIGKIDAGDGNVTIRAGRTIVGINCDAEVDIVGGLVDLRAEAGNIGYLEVAVSSQFDAVALEDNTDIIISSSGDLPIGMVNAGQGDVIVISSGSINDSTEDADVDFMADDLTLASRAEIGGAPGLEIETEVVSLCAISKGAGDIEIRETDRISLIRVGNEDGEIKITASEEKGKVTAYNVQSVSGAVTLSGREVEIKGPCQSGGDVNIYGQREVILEEHKAKIISINNGIINIFSTEDHISMGDDTMIIAFSGDINLSAGKGVALGRLYAESVAVKAGSDRNDRIIDNVVISCYKNITATSTILSAGGSIGKQKVQDRIRTAVESIGATSDHGDIWIVETDDVALREIHAGGKTLYLEVREGHMKNPSGNIWVGDASAEPGPEENWKLTLKQVDSLDMRDFTFQNQNHTDITLESSDGTIVVVDTVRETDSAHKPQNAADSWRSIEATASDDVMLEGGGDITVKALNSKGYILVRSTGGGLMAIGPVQAHTNVTLEGIGDITVSSLTGSTGNVTLRSSTGDVIVNDDTKAGSGITLESSGNISTGVLESAGGNVSVYSTGGDVVISGNVTATAGGVELLADAGRVYISSAGESKIRISGRSDDAKPVDEENPMGVALTGGKGKAAIVIISQESLHLGSEVKLEVEGEYRADDIGIGTNVDDRVGVSFLSSGPPGRNEPGDPIDVSIYLRSTGRDVTVDSEVPLYRRGTVVIDARDKVDFGTHFVDSWAKGLIGSLEVVSRTAGTLRQAAWTDALPGAEELHNGQIPNWIFDASNGYIEVDGTPGQLPSKYVLRGGNPAQVLASTEVSVPLVDLREWKPAGPENFWSAVLAILQAPPPRKEAVQEDEEEQEKRDPSENKRGRTKPPILVIREGRQLGWSDLPQGAALQNGDIIETGEYVEARIEFSPYGERVSLEPKTCVKILGYGVLLHFGQMCYEGTTDSLEDRIGLSTPNVIVDVRGTRIRLRRLADKSTELELLDGVADLRHNGTPLVSLTKHEQARIALDKNVQMGMISDPDRLTKHFERIDKQGIRAARALPPHGVPRNKALARLYFW